MSEPADAFYQGREDFPFWPAIDFRVGGLALAHVTLAEAQFGMRYEEILSLSRLILLKEMQDEQMGWTTKPALSVETPREQTTYTYPREELTQGIADRNKPKDNAYMNPEAGMAEANQSRRLHVPPINAVEASENAFIEDHFGGDVGRLAWRHAEIFTVAVMQQRLQGIRKVDVGFVKERRKPHSIRKEKSNTFWKYPRNGLY